MDIYNWIDKTIHNDKKPMPVLSFPSAQLLLKTVKEMIGDSSLMAMGMRLIADQYDMPAAMFYMDLSVEAEAFGAHTVYSVDEIPTIIGQIVENEEDAKALKVPEIGDGRTGIYVDAVRKSKMLIHDRPLIGGCIGPYSLAGRLMNVNEIMYMLYDEPETVHIVLEKCTDFIIKYAMAQKKAGADGILIAEPLAGLLSPELMAEFSSQYCKKIVDALQDKHFGVFYHNCGNSVNQLVDEIVSVGALGYHFGEKADMVDLLERLPKDVLVMGNISASGLFKGRPETLRIATMRLLEQCHKYPNFLISSGCDLPADTDLDNIDLFFKTARDFYYHQQLWDIIS